jgi:hypothetical protein
MSQLERYGVVPVLGALVGGLSALSLAVSGHASVAIVLLLIGSSALLFLPIDSEPLGTWVGTLLRFISRSRWTACRYESTGRETHLTLRGRRIQQWSTANFRGRGELTESASSQWRAFELLLRRYATYDEPTRFALFDYQIDGSPEASLWVDRVSEWPHPWHASTVPLPWMLTSSWFREEWTYVRDASSWVATVRVLVDAVDSSNLFDRLRAPSAEWEVSLHGEVQPRTKALRRVRRASHATRSDDQLARTFGFTTSVQRAIEHQSVVEREQLVTQGDALLCIALFLTCRASSLSELQQRVRSATAHARSAGVKTQRGWGHQMDWFALVHGGGE